MLNERDCTVALLTIPCLEVTSPKGCPHSWCRHGEETAECQLLKAIPASLPFTKEETGRGGRATNASNLPQVSGFEKSLGSGPRGSPSPPSGSIWSMRFTLPERTLETGLLCTKIHLSSEIFPEFAGRTVVSAVESAILFCCLLPSQLDFSCNLILRLPFEVLISSHLRRFWKCGLGLDWDPGLGPYYSNDLE